MAQPKRNVEDLLAEIEDLRFRLEEAEETLRAIGSGEVDAFVVSGPEGEQVFTLKGAEQPYRVLVETMNEGAATLTGEGTILYCNHRLADLLQVPLEKLIGGELVSFVAPSDRHLFSARLQHCADSCESDEITMVNGAGSGVPVLLSCCSNDDSGSRHISMVLTDLSQQKRNEEILASERLARSIIEQAGEAIIVCDVGGVIIQASSLVHQLCDQNPLLRQFDELFQLQIIDTESLFSAQTPLGGGSYESVEVAFERKGSKRFHLLLNATPLRNAQDRIIGCVVTLTDITERKQAEEALKRMNEELERRVENRTAELAANMEKLEIESVERLHAVQALREKEQMLVQQSRQAALGEMIGNIAHQWRQPLNSLGLTIQKMELLYDMGDLDRSSLQETVAASMGLIHHMSKTIDDFSNFFKPEKEKAPFRAREAVANMLALVEGSFRSEHIGIEVTSCDDPVIYGYHNEFIQVLLNIMNNARDVFTERGVADPKVSIAVNGAGGCVSVTIADNAGGIPDDILEKVFDPYFTTKGPQQGTGVGLFMSKTIIEKSMGGRLSVRNTPHGAEFKIEMCNEDSDR